MFLSLIAVVFCPAAAAAANKAKGARASATSNTSTDSTVETPDGDASVDSVDLDLVAEAVAESIEEAGVRVPTPSDAPGESKLGPKTL